MDNVDIHLLPTQITVYADGFTRAGVTACGNPSAYSEIEGNEVGDVMNTALRPYAVTCPTCLESDLYHSYLKAYELKKSPPYSVLTLDTLSHRIYKNRGIYDVVANNQLRAWLGFVSIFPSEETRARLMTVRDQKEQIYKAKRKRREDIDSYMRKHGIVGDVVVTLSHDMLTGEQSEEVTVVETEPEELSTPSAKTLK